MARQGDAESGIWRGAALRVAEPETLTSATVFSSPHSGRVYPPDFLRRSRLGATALRASEDAFIDDLFAPAPDHGAPMLAAEFPRAWLDVNRAHDELDPALIARLSHRAPRTLRVSAGLGVVPRIVAEGTPIYSGKLSMAEVESRIRSCHAPYHAALSRMLRRAAVRFGTALLVDCHSMPSDPARFGTRRAEIIIGDCYGASADTAISDAVFGLFREAGFRVARNAPFAGGYITQRYGDPSRGINAIQIEIDRALYLDQRHVRRSERYEDFRRTLLPIIAALSDLPARLRFPLAAE